MMKRSPAPIFSIYKQGWMAASHGFHPADNPFFPREGAESVSWRAGWCDHIIGFSYPEYQEAA